ncbi:MAG TPA: outer membrane protein assembly factor BamE [Steroidobacteraceae bacterium]|jgi:outer membrane protein assembly factor BamE|nr:outer membrane protein assembly factor BamE [Steroidobacteraceae bacterium]
MKRLALPTLLLAAGALLSSGCVYRMSIQQGNYLVADSVSQLKEGMTRSQVRFLLGTPMVPDAFNDDRWDYYYFFSSRHQKEPLKRRLTVYFTDEKVARYENLGVPTQSDLEQVEKDLRKAMAETKKKREKPSLWKRMFGRDKPAETTTESSSSDSKTPAEQKPDPVPPPAPVVPEPAGTPSGPG